MAFTILIADDKIHDERDTISDLPHLLRQAGYDVIMTDNADEACTLVWERQPDLAVLDIDFKPQRTSGLDVCRSVRAQERDDGNRLPIILITAVFRETVDVLEGFRLGVDDYVIRPCDNRVILARIRANLPPEIMDIDGRMRIDFEQYRLWVRHDEQWRQIRLPRLQFELLRILVTNAGRILTTVGISEQIFAKDVSQDALAVVIHRLRQSIETDPAVPIYIETIRGVGYRFTGHPVRSQPPESARR